MVFPIPSGFAQATYNWSGPAFNSGVAATVQGFNITGGTLGGLVGALDGIFVAQWAGDMDSDITLESIVAVTATDRFVNGTTHPCTNSLNSPPPNVTVLFKANVPGRGRHNRGRSYWPGLIDKSQVNEDGTLDSGARATIQSDVDAYFAALGVEGYAPVVLHKDGSTPSDIGGWSVEAKVATQRRRLR